MPGGQYIALSGMRTRLDELDRLASDIANAATAGYKSERGSNLTADRPVFNDVLQSAIDVTAGERRLDSRAGAIDPTGRDLDVAIDGDGFFSVQTAAGTRYHAQRPFQPQRRWISDHARRFEGVGHQRTAPARFEQGAHRRGRHGHERRCRRRKTRDRAVCESRRPGPRGSSTLRADDLSPAPAPQATIRAGSLEQSNVSVVERVAELTSATRSFEALQKSVSLMMNDVTVRAIEVLGKR